MMPGLAAHAQLERSGADVPTKRARQWRRPARPALAESGPQVAGVDVLPPNPPLVGLFRLDSDLELDLNVLKLSKKVSLEHLGGPSYSDFFPCVLSTWAATRAVFRPYIP